MNWCDPAVLSEIIKLSTCNENVIWKQSSMLIGHLPLFFFAVSFSILSFLFRSVSVSRSLSSSLFFPLPLCLPHSPLISFPSSSLSLSFPFSCLSFLSYMRSLFYFHPLLSSPSLYVSHQILLWKCNFPFLFIFRYSGITPAMLKGVTTTLVDIQQRLIVTLFCLFPYIYIHVCISVYVNVYVFALNVWMCMYMMYICMYMCIHVPLS